MYDRKAAHASLHAQPGIAAGVHGDAQLPARGWKALRAQRAARVVAASSGSKQHGPCQQRGLGAAVQTVAATLAWHLYLRFKKGGRGGFLWSCCAETMQHPGLSQAQLQPQHHKIAACGMRCSETLVVHKA